MAEFYLVPQGTVYVHWSNADRLASTGKHSIQNTQLTLRLVHMDLGWGGGGESALIH